MDQSVLLWDALQKKKKIPQILILENAEPAHQLSKFPQFLKYAKNQFCSSTAQQQVCAAKEKYPDFSLCTGTLRQELLSERMSYDVAYNNVAFCSELVGADQICDILFPAVPVQVLTGLFRHAIIDSEHFSRELIRRPANDVIETMLHLNEDEQRSVMRTGMSEFWKTFCFENIHPRSLRFRAMDLETKVKEMFAIENDEFCKRIAARPGD